MRRAGPERGAALRRSDTGTDSRRRRRSGAPRSGGGGCLRRRPSRHSRRSARRRSPSRRSARRRRYRLAAALVLRCGRQIVVQVDVQVCRAALSVQVEHAAGPPGRRPPLDGAALGGDDGRPPGDVLDVDPLVPSLAARVAEVHRVGVIADQGEDDRLPVDEPGFGAALAERTTARPRRAERMRRRPPRAVVRRRVMAPVRGAKRGSLPER